MTSPSPARPVPPPALQVKDGAAAWSKSVIDPTLSYATVNAAFDEALMNSGIGGGGGLNAIKNSPPWYMGALGEL